MSWGAKPPPSPDPETMIRPPPESDEIACIALRIFFPVIRQFVDAAMIEALGPAESQCRIGAFLKRRKKGAEFGKEVDLNDVLVFCLNNWHFFERSKIARRKGNLHEIKVIRNAWAHQVQLDDVDVFRLLDSVEKVLWDTYDAIPDLAGTSQKLFELKRVVVQRIAAQVLGPSAW